MSNTITGLCQGFVYPSSSTLGIRFFNKKMIPVILALPPLFTSIGSAVGMWFPQWLMGAENDLSVIQKNMDTLNLVGIISSAPCLLLIIPFVRNHPKVPLMKEKVPHKETFDEYDEIQFSANKDKYGSGSEKSSQNYKTDTRPIDSGQNQTAEHKITNELVQDDKDVKTER